jgi:hypothetical protein
MHVVVFGLAGQELRHTTPLPVAAATYEILDLRKGQNEPARVLASGAATVAAWTLTLDASAGPTAASPRALPVASTVGPSVGDHAFIVAASGAVEGIELDGIVAGAQLRTKANLARAYEIGDEVKPATISAPVPIAVYDLETALDDGQALGVRWSYVLRDVETIVLEQVRLARESIALTSAEAEALRMVQRRYPDMPGRVGADVSLDELARFATDEIRAEYAARGRQPDRSLEGRPGVALIFRKIVQEAAWSGYSPATTNLEAFQARADSQYDAALSRLVVGLGGADAATTSKDSVIDQNPSQVSRAPIRGW